MRQPSKREMDRAYKQLYINNRFVEIFDALGDAIIDASVEHIFKRYKRYPSIHVINLCRKRLRGEII